MANQAALDEIIARVGELPAMPAVVSEVLRITEDPTTAMSEVTKTIQADPALTAKILRLSNSSYYGMKQVVGTLKLALVILGVREVRNIVLGISVFETLKGKNADMVIAEEVWNSSLKAAGVAKKLGAAIGIGLQGEEFITGLLADIGKMVMLRQMEETYAKLFKQHRQNPPGLCEAELEHFGYTHADAATALAKSWNLPKSLSDALWHQYPHPERPLLNAKDPKLAAVVRIAKAAIHDDFEAPGVIALSLDDSEAWEALSGAKHPLAADQRRAALIQYVKEQDSAPALPL